ncbi:MAG: LptF/LptG family permease [Pseudomonadota bacterium]
MRINRLLTGTVGRFVLAAVLLLMGLALGLDLLDSVPEIEEGSVGRYTLLRAPALLLAVAPVGLLAGSAVAFLTMAARRETTVLRAAGIGMGGILRRLLPLALLLGLGLNLVAERVEPAATAALAVEFEDLAGDARPGAGGNSWLRTPQAVLRIRDTGEGARDLRGVSIFQLDREGRAARRLDAERATYRDGVWTLSAVKTTDPEGEGKTETATMRWRTDLTPEAITRLLTPSGMIDAEAARAVLQGEARGLRGPSFYRMRALRGWGLMVLPVVMFILAMPAALGAGRDGRSVRLAALGVTLGFCFLVAEGVARAMGESGALAPMLAVAVPPLVFTLIGLWVLLLAENVTQARRPAPAPRATVRVTP